MGKSGALEQLLRLAEGAKGLADTLARHPILLDELLDGRSLFEPPTAERLRQALDDHVQSLAPGDLERALEELRYFKEATLLRIGACELAGALPTAKVSDALTALAELLCERTLHLAWEETLARYGAPRDHAGQPGSNALCVLAYGKLGGFELGWGSDLDLVFLHDLPPTGQTVGPKVVSNVQFLNRVVQRFMHFLSHRSHSGVLYEIDGCRRLRAAPTFDAFERYQRERWLSIRLWWSSADPGSAPLQALSCLPRDNPVMPRPEGRLGSDFGHARTHPGSQGRRPLARREGLRPEARSGRYRGY